jgi:hypothetical protein
MSPDTQWENQVLDRAKSMLQEVLNTKDSKLKKIVLPKILLIHNTFNLIKINTYLQFKDKIGNLHNYHSIFLIQDNNVYLMLHSKEEAWR